MGDEWEKGFSLMTQMSAAAEGLLPLPRVDIIVGFWTCLENLCFIDEKMETCRAKGSWPRSHSG